MKEPAPSPLAAALAGGLLLVSTMGIGRFAYTPLLPRLRDTLGWSLAQAGDVASANFVGYLLGALLAGRLAGRPTRAGWLFLAMLLSVLSTLAGMLHWSYEGWLALRFVAGVASAVGMVIGLALVIDYVTRAGRPGLSSVAFPGVGVGIVLSVIIIEIAKAGGASVAGQWAGLGICAGVCSAVALPILARLPNLVPSAAPALAAASSTDSSGELRRLIAAYALLGFGYVVTATFIVAMARQQNSAPFIEVLCWLVVGATAAPSVPVGRWLAQRYGVMSVMRGAFCLEAIGVLLAGSSHSTFMLMLGGACLGATFLSITALGLTAARNAAGPAADAAMGWMTAAFGSGQLLGPFVAGRLAQWSGGFALPSALAAGLLLVGAVILPRHTTPAAGTP